MMNIKKIYDYIKSRKVLNFMIHVLPIIALGVCCILYPFWYTRGYFDSNNIYDELYGKIATAVACYGGFGAFLGWYLRNRKNL
jgi:hypothetical protein